METGCFGRILPLPPEVASQIRSSTNIDSLSTVVVGLVQNSLDAQARRIDIHVDFSRGSCTVEDDGCGIEVEDFQLEGGLGKPFHTSKCDSSLSLHGSQGVFLSAVAALALVTITSRRSVQETLSSLRQHHSKVIARLIPAPSHHELSGRCHGTRVTVQDLFGNMPVRVKQRLNAASRTSMDRDLAHLKRLLVGLLLAWPDAVSLTLSESNADKRALTIRGTVGDWLARSAIHKHKLRPDSTSTAKASYSIDAAWVGSVLLQAGFIDPGDRLSWIKTSARTSTVQAVGIISTKPVPTKQFQFLSLGVKPLQSNTVANIIFDDINNAFAASSFGNVEETDSSSTSSCAQYSRDKKNRPTAKAIRGLGKSLERWPIFYIRLQFLEGEDGNDRLEKEAALSGVSKVLRAMIQAFLKDNHFRPKSGPSKRIQTPQSRRTPRSGLPPDVFSSWSRIKTGMPFPCTGDQLAELNKPEVVQVEDNDDQDKSSRPSLNSAIEPLKLIVIDAEEYFECIHPVNQSKILINSRTGMSAPQATLEARPTSAPTTSRAGTIFSSCRSDSRPTTADSGMEGTSWARSFLDSWTNPIFAPTDASIPRVANESNMETLETKLQYRHNLSTEPHPSLVTTTSKLSKAFLATARVISQVDTKFLLLHFNSQGSSSLVLVDQHAADERLRVEALLDDLDSQSSILLPKPLRFELSTREQRLLVQKLDYLNAFGIQIEQSPSDQSVANEERTEVQVEKSTFYVKSLPPVIAERCRLQPSLLFDLIRAVLWSEDQSMMVNAASSQRPAPPRALLDMINSRACRSAIMFNDELSHQEAVTLIQRLSSTKSPFQCAHGRTSMVPLIEFGPQDSVAAFPHQTEEGESFVDCWKRWRSSVEQDERDSSPDGN